MDFITKPSHIFNISDANGDALFLAQVENDELTVIYEKGIKVNVSKYEYKRINDSGFYEMQIKQGDKLICSYHSGSEVTKLYNSSGNVIFHGYDDGDGNKWYDDNGNLLKRQGIEDDPYAQTSWLTSTFYPDGQIKSKTYSVNRLLYARNSMRKGI